MRYSNTFGGDGQAGCGTMGAMDAKEEKQKKSSWEETRFGLWVWFLHLLAVVVLGLALFPMIYFFYSVWNTRVYAQEMCQGVLPWSGVKDREANMRLKEQNLTPEMLIAPSSPFALRGIMQHIAELSPQARPNYERCIELIEVQQYSDHLQAGVA